MGFLCVCYLDDFLIVGSSYNTCMDAQKYLISLLIKLGFAINWEKLTAPAERVKFLGLIIDTNKQCVELPKEKLEAISQITNYICIERKLTSVNYRF